MCSNYHKELLCQMIPLHSFVIISSYNMASVHVIYISAGPLLLFLAPTIITVTMVLVMITLMITMEPTILFEQLSTKIVENVQSNGENSKVCRIQVAISYSHTFTFV